jgi:hypothetical protein
MGLNDTAFWPFFVICRELADEGNCWSSDRALLKPNGCAGLIVIIASNDSDALIPMP